MDKYKCKVHCLDTNYVFIVQGSLLYKLLNKNVLKISHQKVRMDLCSEEIPIIDEIPVSLILSFN